MRHLHYPKIEVWALASSDSDNIAGECYLKLRLWKHVHLISCEPCDNRVIKNHQVSSPWQSKMYSALSRRWDLVLLLLSVIINKECCSYFNLCKDIIEIESRINVWGAWAFLQSYLSGLHDIMKILKHVINGCAIDPKSWVSTSSFLPWDLQWGTYLTVNIRLCCLKCVFELSLFDPLGSGT